MREKPFPWKCPECREKTVRKVSAEYVDKLEHDGREYEIKIPSLEIPCCERCGIRIMTDPVNHAISEALRKAVGLLSPEQIRRNREKVGLTQKELAARLGISDATLSRWETGAQIQQRSLDRWMRVFFSDENIRRKTADDAQMASIGTTVSGQ